MGLLAVPSTYMMYMLEITPKTPKESEVVPSAISNSGMVSFMVMRKVF